MVGVSAQVANKGVSNNIFSIKKMLSFLYSYIAIDLVVEGFGLHPVLSGHLDERDLIVPSKFGDKWRRGVASSWLSNAFLEQRNRGWLRSL